MDVQETIAKARDAISVGRVFGDAYEKDGVTIIPAAWVAGGAGGGSGTEDGRGSGSGSGFGLVAFPVGAFVIKDGDTTWEPAVNVNLLALAALLTLRTMMRARRRRRR